MLQQFRKLLQEGIAIEHPETTLLPPVFYYMLLVFIAFFPVTYLVLWLTPHDLYTRIFILGRFDEMVIWYSFSSIVCAVIFTLLFLSVWCNDLKRRNYSGLVAFIAGTLFAVCFATVVDVVLNVSSDFIRYKYAFYVDYAVDFLKQATLVAIIPIIETIVQYAYPIFRNNLLYSLRSVFAGFVGGFFGFVVLGLMAVFSTGFIWGCTVGLIIRNTLVSGYNPIITPLAAYIAGLGLPPFWHTFWEFFAFAVFGVFGSFISYSLVTRNLELSRIALGCAMVGVFLLLMASFTEVTFDVSIIKLVSGLIVLTPVVSELSINTTWFIGLIATVIFSIAFMMAAAWFLNAVIYYFKKLVVESE